MSTETNRIKLVVAYDGTDFRGWAAQPDQRTVQGTLKEAVRRVTGEELEIAGASRTDGGAHATGQVAHLDTRVVISAEKWVPVLNRQLPLDLRVVAVEAVDETFHARFSAEWRRYDYRVQYDGSDPFGLRFAWHYPRNLNTIEMKAAAQAFIGGHDFLAFTEEIEPGSVNTRRVLISVEVNDSDSGVEIAICGQAFLRGMMRRISGFLIEVGRGYRAPSDAEILLSDRRNELPWPVVLPARGLCLREVKYQSPYPDHRSPNEQLQDFSSSPRGAEEAATGC